MVSKLVKAKFEEVSNDVRKAAEEWLDGCLSDPLCGLEERKLARKDMRDVRKISFLLKKGDIVGARSYAERLDTLVREVVPESFWELSDNFNRLLSTRNKTFQG